MKICLLRKPTHRYSDLRWPPVGQTMEVPEGLAAYMIDRGEAEAVKEEPVVETAEVAPPEKVARTHKPKPRGSAKSFSAKKG